MADEVESLSDAPNDPPRDAAAPQVRFDVVALVKDLLFSSKVTATARAAGKTTRVVRSAEQLAAIDASLCVVDLSVANAVEAASAWRSRTAGVVLATVSHVDAQKIVEARKAGLDHVVANSAFESALARLLLTPASKWS